MLLNARELAARLKYGRNEGRQAMTRPRYRSKVFQKSTTMLAYFRERLGQKRTGFYDGDLAVGSGDKQFIKANDTDDHVDDAEKEGQVNTNSQPSFDHEIRYDQPGKNKDCHS